MPQVAYYRAEVINGPTALAMVTAMHKSAIAILGYDHQRVAYLADFVKDVAAGASFTCFERVKVEVADVAEALALAQRPDFVRYFVGARTIEEVISERKREGRSDWYC